MPTPCGRKQRGCCVRTLARRSHLRALAGKMPSQRGTRAAHALEACMQENTRGICAPLKSAVCSHVSASRHLQIDHPLAFCHAPAQGRILLIKKVAPLAPHALNLPPAHANVPGQWRCAACLRHAELSLERMHLGANLLNLFGPAAVETRRE